MGFPQSIKSYPDIREIFDRALVSEKGLRLVFATPGEALYNAGRFNYFRRVERRENAKIYPADHDLHNRTIYDGLQVRHRKGELVVQVVKLDASNFNVEEIE